jgi:hypothetical protein
VAAVPPDRVGADPGLDAHDHAILLVLGAVREAHVLDARVLEDLHAVVPALAVEVDQPAPPLA